MAYRTRIYVAFDADSDIHYYRLMQAWDENERTEFEFLDAHDLNNIMRWSSEETIKRDLGERLARSRLLLCLIGEKTKFLNKFVRWELEYAVRNDLPIIGANLNGYKGFDSERCPPVIRDELVLHVPFMMKAISYALKVWPDVRLKLSSGGIQGPRILSDSIIAQLGI